ncbi:hypothetical protein V8E53_015865 [Lactarius tabidus]
MNSIPLLRRKKRKRSPRHLHRHLRLHQASHPQRDLGYSFFGSDRIERGPERPMGIQKLRQTRDPCYQVCGDTDLPSPSDEHRVEVRCLTSPAPPETNARKCWTMEEMRMFVGGCNCHGANRKAILNDASLHFDNRSPVDLKDRLRTGTYFRDAYKQHYPNAKTILSFKIRSTLLEDARSQNRCLFTEEEDRVLKAGYDKTVWTTILSAAARAATDEHLHASRETGPARRKRHYTAQGFLRRGTKSVP